MVLARGAPDDMYRSSTENRRSRERRITPRDVAEHSPRPPAKVFVLPPIAGAEAEG